jgi:hypothetical protein
MLRIQERVNKKIAIKPVKMNTNPPIPNGQPPFDRYNFALLICGQPNSGKSSFFFDQLTRPKSGDTPSGMFYKKFHKVHIFSPSTHTLGRKLYVPEDQIYKEFDPEVIGTIIEEQQADFEEVRQANEEIKEYNKTHKDKEELQEIQQVLIVFDDMMADIAKDKSRQFMRMIMNRRHLGITVVCMTQVFNRIPAKLRKGFSDVMLFKTKNRKELDSIREELTAFNPKEFDELVEATLQNQHDFVLFKTYSDEIYRNLNPLMITEYDTDESVIV